MNHNYILSGLILVRSLSLNLVLFCDRAEQSMKIGMMFFHGILNKCRRGAIVGHFFLPK